MPLPQKICPKCQAVAALDTPICRNCGHGFSTQFAPPVIPTLPPTHFNHHMATLHKRPALTIVIVCAGVIGILLLVAAARVFTPQSPSLPPSTDVVLDQSAENSLFLQMPEEQMLALFGKPGAAPIPTDTRGHLWVYDLKQGGCLAARFEWNGRDYILTDAMTINSPAKWEIRHY